MEEEVLVYIKEANKYTDGTFEYDFFFSNTPDIVWGPDWEVSSPVSCGDITPDKTTYTTIKRVKTTLPLKTIEETSCYSMEYAINGIVALAWIDLENLEDYPENGRMVFHFGDSVEKTEELLGNYDYKFEN